MQENGSRRRLLRRRSRSVLGLAVSTAICASALTAKSAPAAVTRHAIFLGSGASGMWEASPDGSNARHLSGEPSGEPALSPDGRTMAFENDPDRTLRIADVTGGPSTVIATAPEHQELRNPRFSPDGKKLLYQDFWWSGEDTANTVNLDGTEPELLATHLAYHGLGGYSPDANKVVFVKKALPGTYSGEPEVYIANADGSSPTSLTNWEMVEDPIEPEYSPDGSKIVFAAIPPEEREEYTYQLFTINTDGTGIQQLTSGELYATSPHWTPDGSKIVYSRWGWGVEEKLYKLNSDGSGEPEDFEPLIAWSGGIAFSPPGATANVSDDEYLGATFEPQLYFDSQEQWRPLNVDSFMREEDPENPGHSFNKLCIEEGCEDIPEDWQLAMHADAEVIESKEPHIKMGALAEQEHPTSPNPACRGEGRTDCDSGSAAALYYHVAPSANEGEKTDAGYNYVDFWTFYRYNKGTLDNHSGDWEGLTVAPSLGDPNTFDFAIFAQHASHSVYAPENLQCDGGGEGSCGTTLLPGGQRVWDFVAEGTHAAYPGKESTLEHLFEVCIQAKETLPEGCHDGAAPWAANFEPQRALQFPSAHEGNWVDWPGLWGEDEGNPLETNLEKSPASPGVQQRFKCPWSNDPEIDSTACPSSVVHSLSGQRDAIASTCANWFGGTIAITACSPSELRRAVHAGRMDRPGGLRVLLDRRRRHAASLPGVAQALGAPLTPGETATVSGRASGDTELLVRATEGSHLTTAVFRGPVLGGRVQGQISVVAGRHHAQIVWRGRSGKPVLPTKETVSALPSRPTSRGPRGPLVRRSPQPTRASMSHPSSRALRNKRHACRRAMMIYVRDLIANSRAGKRDSHSAIAHPGPKCRIG